MRDPIRLVESLRARGVALEIREGKLKCRGALTSEDRNALVECAPFLEAILIPDLTLPDDLFIPADCPNDLVSIAACIDSQRIRIAA
jgi:hypothetical protein